MFFEQMKKEQKSVEGRIARLEEKLKEMPEGKLICAKNGKGYKWYTLLNGKYEYIPKRNKELAEALAKKRELITILQEAKSEKKVYGYREVLKGILYPREESARV